MRLTRLLPKKLAISWQEYDLVRTEGNLEYHREMARVLEEMSKEGREELLRLTGGSTN